VYYAGSGLGTSSILVGAVLAAVGKFGPIGASELTGIESLTANPCPHQPATSSLSYVWRIAQGVRAGGRSMRRR
jgi:hypothetical protein